MQNVVKILAIETSCDETAITVLECTGDLPLPQFTILGNSLISQIDIHKEYGGVYPMLAKREHEKNLPILLKKTLAEAGINEESPDIDMIAVTNGPGLEPALWAGLVFAEELGKKWNKQVVPVNHMEGHIWSVLFGRTQPLEFPLLALLVSGGHTELVEVKDFKTFTIIGRTRDDAVGEAFDKAARLLDMPYPGGPKLSALASLHRSKGLTPTFEFPRPMLNSPDFDFSYSGLKTAVLYKVRDLGTLSEGDKGEIAHAFEDAAIGVLVEKTRRAIQSIDVRTLIVGGGVSGNTYLQSELRKMEAEAGIPVLFPSASLTTDNAVMIGMAAYIIHLSGRTQPQAGALAAKGNLEF